MLFHTMDVPISLRKYHYKFSGNPHLTCSQTMLKQWHSAHVFSSRNITMYYPKR